MDMKVISYRTTMPFDGGLSPTTPKSVVPTNNVHTIQDVVMNGRQYVLPGGAPRGCLGRGIAFQGMLPCGARPAGSCRDDLMTSCTA